MGWESGTPSDKLKAVDLLKNAELAVIRKSINKLQ